MYDDYIAELKKRYDFDDITYALSLDEGFSVTVSLTSPQIRKYNSLNAHELKAMIYKAEMFAVTKRNIPLGMIPITRIYEYHTRRVAFAAMPDLR